MFLVAREYNHHGDCDYLFQFDSQWVAAFASAKIAMRFDTVAAAQATADYLKTNLPSIIVNTIKRRDARYKVVPA